MRRGVLAADVVQLDGAPLLWRSRAQRAQQLLGAALQGQQADAEGVEFPQHGLRGEAAVEDQLLGVGAGRVGEEERTVGGALNWARRLRKEPGEQWNLVAAATERPST